MEKFARDAVADDKIQCKEDIVVSSRGNSMRVRAPIVCVPSQEIALARGNVDLIKIRARECLSIWRLYRIQTSPCLGLSRELKAEGGRRERSGSEDNEQR